MKGKNFSIFVLTGAGISAESGIRTFRDSDGLWENHRIEDVASPEGFARNPKLVQDFYNARRRQLLSDEVRPNPAHAALALLEREFRGRFLLVTQNVDDLHERGGSLNLRHMHGELLKMRCTKSGEVYSVRRDILPDSLCECCESRGTLRPDIVWFGEVPYHMEEIQQQLARCDLFLSIGTSSLVYPAASFVEMAKQNGKSRAIEVNLDNTGMSRRFDGQRRGTAGVEVPKLVSEILAGAYP